MMFLLEIHGYRGFRVFANAEGVTARIFFVTASAHSSTMSDQIKMHKLDAAVESTSGMLEKMMRDIRQYGKPGTIENVEEALEQALINEYPGLAEEIKGFMKNGI